MAIARDVRVEQIVEDYLQAEERKYTRVRDIFNALTWRIAREPEVGEPVTHLTPTRYLVKSIPFRFPVPIHLKLLYRYDDEQVVVEFAQIETLSDVDNM